MASTGAIPYLVEFHQLFSIHLLCLVQRNETDIFGREGFIGEWALDGIQIMGTNCHERSLPGKVLVEFILQGNEAFITSLVEFHISQNSTAYVRSYSGRLSIG